MSDLSLRVKRHAVNGVRIAIVTTMVVIVVVPFAWVVTASLKPQDALVRGPFDPFTPQLDTWREVLRSGVTASFTRSAIVGIATVGIAVVVGSLAAYAISRFRTGGAGMRFGVLAGQMIPPAVLVIPLFLIAFQFGLNDSLPAVIASHLTFVLPLVTWFLIGFFDEVPREYEEQAMVDGYTRWRAFYKVVLPQVRPGIGAAAIFGFILSWNDLFYALILGGGRARTLPVAIAGFNTFRGVELGRMSVAILMSVIPVLIASFFVQRRLIQGLGSGGLKG
jgi:ABC-type glycerol-3-phosphate transport system permease component